MQDDAQQTTEWRDLAATRALLAYLIGETERQHVPVTSFLLRLAALSLDESLERVGQADPEDSPGERLAKPSLRLVRP